MENFWRCHDAFWGTPQTRNTRITREVLFDRAVREARKAGPDAVRAIGPLIEMAKALEALK
jgi:hypothetical protein